MVTYFSCLDWCDGRVGENICNSNRIEFVNSIGNSNFVNRRTVRPRGVLEVKQFVLAQPQRSLIFAGANALSVGSM